jgi:nitroreductase
MTEAPVTSIYSPTQPTVAEAIRERRTIRHYLPKAVPPEILHELLELALEAPSSWNLQDRSIVVVTSDAGRGALTQATGGQPQPRECPVMLVFLADLFAHKRDHTDIWEAARRSCAWNDEYIRFCASKSREFQEKLAARGKLREYAIKDAMIAASFFLLAAQSYGLATSPMNGWEEDAVKKAIGAEDREDLAVALLVSVGYAAETRLHPGRRATDRNVFFETVA